MEELRARSLKEVVLAYFDTQYRKEGRKFMYADLYSNVGNGVGGLRIRGSNSTISKLFLVLLTSTAVVRK